MINNLTGDEFMNSKIKTLAVDQLFEAILTLKNEKSVIFSLKTYVL